MGKTREKEKMLPLSSDVVPVRRLPRQDIIDEIYISQAKSEMEQPEPTPPKRDRRWTIGEFAAVAFTTMVIAMAGFIAGRML